MAFIKCIISIFKINCGCKINDLIKEIERTPFTGTGKPEALKYSLSGYWSRRINHEHRIVYQVERQQLVFISFRYHYEK